jgi:hypothetical protein
MVGALALAACTSADGGDPAKVVRPDGARSESVFPDGGVPLVDAAPENGGADAAMTRSDASSDLPVADTCLWQGYGQGGPESPVCDRAGIFAAHAAVNCQAAGGTPRNIERRAESCGEGARETAVECCFPSPPPPPARMASSELDRFTHQLIAVPETDRIALLNRAGATCKAAGTTLASWSLLYDHERAPAALRFGCTNPQALAQVPENCRWHGYGIGPKGAGDCSHDHLLPHTFAACQHQGGTAADFRSGPCESQALCCFADQPPPFEGVTLSHPFVLFDRHLLAKEPGATSSSLQDAAAAECAATNRRLGDWIVFYAKDGITPARIDYGCLEVRER